MSYFKDSKYVLLYFCIAFKKKKEIKDNLNNSKDIKHFDYFIRATDFN